LIRQLHGKSSGSLSHCPVGYGREQGWHSGQWHRTGPKHNFNSRWQLCTRLCPANLTSQLVHQLVE
jgi:hypothetical protein